jgi:bifunctional UDP-N-acetylglucosamine pyrophosphorylase/glucosamine-1-phosphate N-acetyltransferase
MRRAPGKHSLIFPGTWNIPKPMKPLNVVVMAAGNSTRLKSPLTKVLHPIGGRPMLDSVLAAARSLRPQKIVLVLGNDRERVSEYLKGQRGLHLAHQKVRLGTAHAVQTGLQALREARGDVLILSGDVPLIRAQTLKSLRKQRGNAPLALLTAVLPNPYGYGRVLRDRAGRVFGIVEEKNASPEQRLVNEINAGVYLADAEFLRAALAAVKKDPVKKEYYLTDIVRYAVQSGRPVASLTVRDAHEVLGANDRAELAFLNRQVRQEIVGKHLQAGVGMEDPESVVVDFGVRVGADSFLGRGVHLLGRTRVGRGCRIEAGCFLTDAAVGDGVHLKAYSYLEDCTVGEGAVVGPFARLRPGTVVERDAHIGNFVELKKTRMARGSKANHLSYLGDATIGQGVNIGAGTITCNYDGKKKYPTRIADGVFVGSDTQFIAPVTIGRGAYIAAGTTVTENVPPGALAISRVPQKNIKRYKKR